MGNNQKLIIKSNGEIIPTEPENGQYYDLSELKHIVGGFIEIKELSDNKTMVLNELGKLDKLPYNKVATAMYRSAYPLSNDYIVGDVLVLDSERIY